MNPRERFLATMRYEPVDRAPYTATYGWPETHDRWRSEGWDGRPFSELYGTEDWLWLTHLAFPYPPFQEEVIEEREHSRVVRNHEGILMEIPSGYRDSSMPHFLRFPVETIDDFRQFAAERMQPRLEERLGPNWESQCTAWRDRTQPLIVFTDRWGGFFGPLRNLMGVENLCVAFHQDPALVEAMMDHIADFLIALMDRVLQMTSIDMFAFWEDMCYRTGPLISPVMARKYMLPRYRRVTEFLRSRGVGLIGLDSDGDVTGLLPVWLDAGINVLWPFEVQSGMDVVALRKRFGRDLRMMGGIDKRALAQDEPAIRSAVDAVMPVVADGGYVPYLDHSCPPDIPWCNACYYTEYLGKRLNG